MASEYLRGTVLDIGCGPADITQYLPNQSIKYVGVDVNKKEIEALKQSKPAFDFFWVDVDKENLPLEASKYRFNTVLLLAVIEHLKYPDKLLEEVKNLMTDDGRLIISTSTPTGEIVHNMLAIFGLTSAEAVREHKTAAHSSYSFKQLCNLILKCGFEIETYKHFELGLNQIIVFKKIS
jgi:2-polyprenyl-3-methyl-5-hydroxy-6-metoxy-1,4-benzoquinol methylase